MQSHILKIIIAIFFTGTAQTGESQEKLPPKIIPERPAENMVPNEKLIKKISPSKPANQSQTGKKSPITPNQNTRQDPKDGKKKLPTQPGTSKPTKEASPEKQLPNLTPQSPLSLKLSERLWVAASYGIGSVRSGDANWKGLSGVTDFSLNFIFSKFREKSSLLATFRYQSMDTLLHKNNASNTPIEYRGVIEGLHFGTGYLLQLNEKISITTTAEIGLMKTKINPWARERTSEPSLGSLDAHFTLGGAIDWKLQEKIRLGPKLHIGLGDFITTQLGANIVLIF